MKLFCLPGVEADQKTETGEVVEKETTKPEQKEENEKGMKESAGHWAKWARRAQEMAAAVGSENN